MEGALTVSPSSFVSFIGVPSLKALHVYSPEYLHPSLLMKAPCGELGIPFQTVMGLGYPGSAVLFSSL